MPTPVITHTQLGWAYLSEVISLVKPRSSFLKGLMFGDRMEALPTESVELSYIVGNLEMAPFVEVNSEAVSVKGLSVEFANVSTPNIRIKRPMDAWNVFLRRQPGTGIFVSGGGQIAAARNAAIAQDAQILADMIERREEWMISQLLTNNTSGAVANMQLSYSVSERANWTLSIPRPHATEFVRTALANWSTSTEIAKDFHAVKRVMAKHQQLVPTHCLLGSTAATNFINNSAVQTLLDKRNISAGDLQLQNQFTESGAIFLGNFMGISVWEYSAEYVDDAGSNTPYIGAEQAIFVHASPANMSTMYYGAIPDHEAFEQGSFVGSRFSKAWVEKDPSVYVQLLHSRPLPFIKKTGSVVVLDTTP